MSVAQPNSVATIAADDVRPWFPANRRLAPSRCDPGVTASIAGRLMNCPTATITRVSPADPVFRRAAGRGDVALCATSFANAIIATRQRAIVLDATLDPRFRNMLQVTLFPKARFLAGFPILGARREILGALTLVDYVPRDEPDPKVVEEVQHLADLIAVALMPVDGTA